MKQLKITISFSKEYKDVYDLLKAKGNCSRYLCELVRGAEQPGSLEARIEKIVVRMLGQNSGIKQDDLKKAIDNFEF